MGNILDILSGFNNILCDPFGIGTAIQSALITIGVIGFILAMPQCLFGYKILKFLIALQGFFIGGILECGILGALSQSGEGAVLGFLIGAVLGAIISYKVYKIGVFCIGFGLGGGASMLIILQLSHNIPASIFIGIIGGIAIGVLLVLFSKSVINVVWLFI